VSGLLRWKQDGFTLLELLVVVAIILMLMAILLPILQAAKERSYRTTCQNNLKQIIIAALMYADEWDGYLPPVDSVNGGPGTNAAGLHADVDPFSLYNLLRRYTKSGGVFKCDMIDWADPYDPGHGNYGVLNYYYHRDAVVTYNPATGSYTPAKKRDLVRFPSRSVLIMDWFWLLNDFPVHQEGANYAFVDGHIQWYSNRVYSPSKGYPPFYY